LQKSANLGVLSTFKTPISELKLGGFAKRLDVKIIIFNTILYSEF